MSGQEPTDVSVRIFSLKSLYEVCFAFSVSKEHNERCAIQKAYESEISTSTKLKFK